MREALQGPHPPHGSLEVWPFAITRPASPKSSAGAAQPARPGGQANPGRARKTKAAKAAPKPAGHAR